MTQETAAPETVAGILKLTKTGGALRDPARSFKPGPRDVAVPQRLIREFGLSEGAAVCGYAQGSGNRRELAGIESVCGLPPDQYSARPTYTQLTAVDPNERFDLGASGDVDLRVIDLVAPIGKGTRGLIVSPPKAGKTILLEKIARAIRAADPAARVVMLLIDERPEEVTHFRRSVDAEIFSSTNDQTAQDHTELAELLMANARADLECGRDVVVLVDSLTRMGRAFNTRGSGTGRTLSGGVEAGALEIPRKFFGLARNAEGGGSVTIIATALVETGSRMDDLIFQEFKGTGNSEIMLDRSLAESRIFPAININMSGTRKEERLHTPEDARAIGLLRRALSGQQPKDAMRLLLEQMKKHPTNEALLRSVGKN